MVVAQEKTRGADRRRYSAAGRQCGRCRGRDRLCAGRDLSARRQYRRRRLHGDPSRPSATKTSPSTIARPRRRRPRAISSSAPTASPMPTKSRNSALGIGVPGTVAGLALALEKYGSGKFTLAQICQARDRRWRATALSSPTTSPIPAGHVIARMARWPSSAKIFSRADGTPLRDGDRLIQTDLAATLAAIAEQGPRGFYEGPVAEKLAKAVTRCRRHHDAGRSEILSGR